MHSVNPTSPISSILQSQASAEAEDVSLSSLPRLKRSLPFPPNSTQKPLHFSGFRAKTQMQIASLNPNLPFSPNYRSAHLRISSKKSNSCAFSHGPNSPETQKPRKEGSDGNFFPQFQTDLPPVKILKLDARPLDVPLLAPFTIASANVTRVENVAIRTELLDGSVGWGEVPIMPPVTAENQEEALAGAALAGDWLERQEAATWLDLIRGLGEYMPGHQYAAIRAGVEMSIVDAVARSQEIPLWAFFGGCSDRVTTDITIPICSPSTAAELAAHYWQRGFLSIKTKIGGTTVDADVARLSAIRRGHPTCDLLLDANCGYTSEQALQVLERLHDLGLDPILFEQPTPRRDWLGIRHVSEVAGRLYGVQVAADESCRSLADAERIASRQLAGAINIKLAKVGVLGALEIVHVARRHGLALMIGGMVETRIGMGFSAHLAAGLGGFRFVDLDTPLLLANDPVRGGYRVNGPLYELDDQPGHGGTLDWD